MFCNVARMCFHSLLFVFGMCTEIVLHFCFRQTGAIFDEDDIYGVKVLDFSVTRQNVVTSKYRLESLVKRIPSMDAAKVEKAGLNKWKTQFCFEYFCFNS